MLNCEKASEMPFSCASRFEKTERLCFYVYRGDEILVR